VATAQFCKPNSSQLTFKGTVRSSRASRLNSAHFPGRPQISNPPSPYLGRTVKGPPTLPWLALSIEHSSRPRFPYCLRRRDLNVFPSSYQSPRSHVLSDPHSCLDLPKPMKYSSTSQTIHMTPPPFNSYATMGVLQMPLCSSNPERV